MAATDVTNQNIIDNLRQLGYQIPPDFDISGAQNSDFANRVMAYIQPQMPAGQYGQDAFNHAKDVAQKLQVIPTDATGAERMRLTLSAYGVDGHTMNQIIAK